MALKLFSAPTAVSLVIAIITALFVSYLITFMATVVYNLYFHPLAKYPGPASRGAFYLPEALSRLSGTAFKDTKLLHDKYGGVVRIEPDALSFTSAQAWKDIYGLKPDRTELDRDRRFFSQGTSTILVANQTNHNRVRKVLAHAFSDGALLEQEPLMTCYFDLLISKLKQQIDGAAHGRVNMMAYYNFMTFDIIADLILGEPFGALEDGEYHSWIRNVFETSKFLGVLRFVATYPAAGLLLKLFNFLVPAMSAKQNAHLAFTNAKTQKRLDRKTDRKDFMTYILRHNDERGLSLKEIIGNSRVLLVAGSETTAALLSGATYYLLQNPSALHRVQSEVRTVFDKQDEITLHSVSTSSRLPYLEAVLHESLRCYPPVPANLPRRTGPEGALIDGKFIPGNTSVGVHQWSTYRSSANFASPNRFAPERWLPNPPPEFQHDDKAALQPFSLGPRGCLGKTLAYFEMRSVLARVLWNFDMQLEAESHGWTEQKEYTIWDRPPLWVRLKYKEAAVGK